MIPQRRTERGFGSSSSKFQKPVSSNEIENAGVTRQLRRARQRGRERENERGGGGGGGLLDVLEREITKLVDCSYS